MLQWLRKLTGVSARPSVPATSAPSIRARYDNAQTTDDNRRNWWMADYFSARSANSWQVRRQLRMRSRYEVANADDLIDRGPTLQVTTNNKSFNRQIETAWNEWADEVGLVSKLRTAKLAKTIDGEGFLVLKTVEELYSSVKLYPVDIEADQVTTPAPANIADLWVDGLTLHPITGEPIEYHVLKHHPGDFFFPDFNPMAVEKIKRRWVIHWFQKFRPGQVRGVPVFTSALDLFTELRSFRKAVLMKMQTAANLTAVLKTKGPPDNDGTATATPFQNIPIDRGTMTTLPNETEMQQYDTGEAGTSYEMFQEKCLGEACRPLNYPLNLALGTSQKFNFSSAKLDHINYRQGLGVERTDCDREVLNRLFAAWFEEAVRVPKLMPKGVNSLLDVPHEWHWPGFPTLDAQADTAAYINQINAGTLTWREFWAKRCYDWRDVMAQQALEKDEIELLGLEFGEPMKKQIRVDETPAEAGVSGYPAKPAKAPTPAPKERAAA